MLHGFDQFDRLPADGQPGLVTTYDSATSHPDHVATAHEEGESNIHIAMHQRIAKRAFDIVVASTALIMMLPFLIILSIMLQIDSPGRLLFIQQRVGRGGRMFPCIKFRTMCEDAEQVLAELLANSPEARAEWARDHKLRDDPRVSRLGRLMRKLSLDELPQLLNILLGHMSIVGPRPIVRAEIEKYGYWFTHYCSVRPGLTGLWQVSGRNDVSYPERVQFDRRYANDACFALDMSIIVRTVPAVLRAQGSY
jgi:exopolysaccharide production protein ExoY